MSSTPNFMRCYCNLPECIDRGENTCKSRTGCFQELPHYNLRIPIPIFRRLDKGQTITPVPTMDLRFGCLELWPSDSAPFQCTEPGIRKSPLSDGPGGRRNGNDGSSDPDMDDGDQWVGRSKNGDRSGVARRRSSANRHSHHKAPESRRWNAYDVPLRCCVGDMCNRRFSPSVLKSINADTSSPSTTANPVAFTEEASTISMGAGHPWWFTSTMIFVPVIGGITFFVLVAIGCWILNYGTVSPCQNRKRAKLTVDGTSVSVPAHYYFYDASGLHAGKNSVNIESSDKNSTKPCKCVVVETAADFSTMASGGRCVHILPIFLSKYSHNDCVVNVKAADTRTLGP